MAGLSYLRADDNILYGATVTTTAGATDSTYTDDWLCDGRNRPVRSTTGTVTWAAVASAAGIVDAVVVHGHSIDAGRTVTIAGDVSGSGVGLTARANDIPADIWIPVNAGSPTEPVTDVSVAVASNSQDVVIAEFLAGNSRQTTRHFFRESVEIGYLDIGTVYRQSAGGAVPHFSRGLTARYIKGELLVTAADRDALFDWYESTREETKPSAIKPFSDSNEAWTVSFGAKPTATSTRGYWLMTLVFHEWPRKRWIP